MVHPREGGGKISSPHLVEAFGDQNPPKMGRCDQDWIIILFIIHLDAFRMENVKESSHRNLFTGGTQFGKLGSEIFRERFEASNDVFLRKNFAT